MAFRCQVIGKWRGRKLPDSMRKEFKEPIGRLVLNKDVTHEHLQSIIGDRMIIACGDATALRLEELGIGYSLAIIDGKTKRGTNLDVDCLPGAVTSIKNPPAMITNRMFNLIRENLDFLDYYRYDKLIIDVIGEEDLAVIPCIICGKIGTVICYGQPNEGMVIVKVSRKLKKLANDIYNRMDRYYTRGS